MRDEKSPLEQQTLEALLVQIRQRFYGPEPGLYYRDRKMLIYALSWPAQWLVENQLTINPAHYQRLIGEHLEGILRHGDKSKYEAYFPRYLLKSLQESFRRQEDRLYEELSHISQVLERLEILHRPNIGEEPPNMEMHILAKTHELLAAQYRSKKLQNKEVTQQNALQMNLF